MPHWTRTNGNYTHPHIAGVITSREGDALHGHVFDASRTVKYEGPGWIFIQGLASWGVFRRLDEAQRWALKHKRRSAKDRVAYERIDVLTRAGHTTACAHHMTWTKGGACTCGATTKPPRMTRDEKIRAAYELYTTEN